MDWVDLRTRDNLEGVTKESTGRLLSEKGPAAAAYVKRHAVSPEDEAMLLDMLGLSSGEDVAAA